MVGASIVRGRERFLLLDRWCGRASPSGVQRSSSCIGERLGSHRIPPAINEAPREECSEEGRHQPSCGSSVSNCLVYFLCLVLCILHPHLLIHLDRVLHSATAGGRFSWDRSRMSTRAPSCAIVHVVLKHSHPQRSHRINAKANHNAHASIAKR